MGALLCVTMVPTAAAPVRIELLGSASVSGRVVTLGQVAHVSSSDLAVLRRLLALPLGAAPAPDTAVTLDRAVLSRWLRVRGGLSARDIEWSGEDEVSIYRLVHKVKPADLVAIAQTRLAQWLDDRSERFELRVVTDPRSLRVPQGGVRLVVRPLAYERPLRRMQLWVDVWSGNAVVSAVPITFEVKAYSTAAVAAHDLGTDSATERAVTNEEVELTAWPGKKEPLTASEVSAMEASRLRRPLREGEPVTAADVEAAPAVQRGDWATLRLLNGPLALESKVEVLHDAWIGQRVRVRTTQADSPLLVRVTGRGQLELQP